jgi:hypothetical protein
VKQNSTGMNENIYVMGNSINGTGVVLQAKLPIAIKQSQDYWK